MKEIKIQVALCDSDIVTGQVTIQMRTVSEKYNCIIKCAAKVENNDLLIKEKVKLMFNELLKQITLNNE